MVRSMYPPLDPRLLEARAAALTLAVTHLALIARYEYGEKGKFLSWIDKSLAEMDGHMMVCLKKERNHSSILICFCLGVKRSLFNSRIFK